MKAARCRIARDGDLVNGWKRLFGFRRARVSRLEYPDDVEALAIDSPFCGKTRGGKDGLVGFAENLVVSRLVGREPNLRTKVHPLFEARCIRIDKSRGLTPFHRAWRQRPQVYSPAIVVWFSWYSVRAVEESCLR